MLVFVCVGGRGRLGANSVASSTHRRHYQCEQYNSMMQYNSLMQRASGIVAWSHITYSQWCIAACMVDEPISSHLAQCHPSTRTCMHHHHSTQHQKLIPTPIKVCILTHPHCFLCVQDNTPRKLSKKQLAIKLRSGSKSA